MRRKQDLYIARRKASRQKQPAVSQLPLRGADTGIMGISNPHSAQQQG
jgi:hypothetical protein